MSRLLTDVEIAALVKAIPTATELALARIARREQDAKTLKEVGELLRKHDDVYPENPKRGEVVWIHHIRLTSEDWQLLLRGERPGEGKGG